MGDGWERKGLGHGDGGWEGRAHTNTQTTTGTAPSHSIRSQHTRTAVGHRAHTVTADPITAHGDTGGSQAHQSQHTNSRPSGHSASGHSTPNHSTSGQHTVTHRRRRRRPWRTISCGQPWSGSCSWAHRPPAAATAERAESTWERIVSKRGQRGQVRGK